MVARQQVYLFPILPGNNKNIKEDGIYLCTGHHETEKNMNQVCKENSSNKNQMNTDNGDYCVPKESFEVSGRQGKFLDAALFGEQVVKHISRRYYHVSHSYPYDNYGIDSYIIGCSYVRKPGQHYLEKV
jgi:hypothetical protein